VTFFYLDIDECSINNGECHDQAICANTPGSFSCACKPGYSGNGLNCTGIFLFSSHSLIFIHFF